jgi:transposase InsO family protein
LYYQPQASADDELKAAIEEVMATWPTYGYRRVTAQIRRDKQGIVTGKRVRRLMPEMGLQAKVRSKRRGTTESRHDYPRYPNLVQNPEGVRPDQVWVSAIPYGRLLMEFGYLAVIMDVFTRAVRGWHLARNLDYELTLTARQRALADGHQPEIHLGHELKGKQGSLALRAALAYNGGASQERREGSVKRPASLSRLFSFFRLFCVQTKGCSSLAPADCSLGDFAASVAAAELGAVSPLYC